MKKFTTSLTLIISLLLSGCWFLNPVGRALFNLGNAESITIDIDATLNGTQIRDFVFQLDGHKTYFGGRDSTGIIAQFYVEDDPKHETVDFYMEDWNHNWSVHTLTYEEYGYDDRDLLYVPFDYESFTQVEGDDTTYTVEDESLIQFNDFMGWIPEIDRNAFIDSVTLHLSETKHVDYLSIEFISEEGLYHLMLTYSAINSTSITLPTVLG